MSKYAYQISTTWFKGNPVLNIKYHPHPKAVLKVGLAKIRAILDNIPTLEAFVANPPEPEPEPEGNDLPPIEDKEPDLPF